MDHPLPSFCRACGSSANECSLLCPVEHNLAVGWRALLPDKDFRRQMQEACAEPLPAPRKRSQSRLGTPRPKRKEKPDNLCDYLTADVELLGRNVQCPNCGLINKYAPCQLCQKEANRGLAMENVNASSPSRSPLRNMKRGTPDIKPISDGAHNRTPAA